MHVQAFGNGLVPAFDGIQHVSKHMVILPINGVPVSFGPAQVLGKIPVKECTGAF
jgi:hypothetical protein